MHIRIRLVAAWALAILLALNFAGYGLTKLSPNQAMVERFENWGYSGPFARVIGVMEITGALLVLFPSFAAYGAGILAVVMIGAVYTHLSTGIGDPSTAATLMVITGILIALRGRDARRIPARRIDLA